MQLEALLCVELRSAEGVDCETLFGWDSTCETAVVPASTLDVVFIAFGVLNGLVRLSLEICHLDKAENPWVVVVAFNVVDADCVVFPDWEDDDLCNTLEDSDICRVGVVSFMEGELVCATFVAIPVFNVSACDVIAKVVTAVAIVVAVAVAFVVVVASFKS